MNYPSLRLVFDRKKTATSEKKAVVHIELLLDARKKYISTEVKIYPNEWDKTRQIIINRNDALILNQRISKQIFKIQKYILDLQEHDESFSFAAFEAFINNKGLSENFLAWLFREINDNDLEESTRTQHLVVYRKLLKYGKIQSFRDVNENAFMAFHKWLKLVDMKGCSKESIFGVHKRIKPYIKIALRQKLIKENPYDYIKIEREKNTAVRYLNEDELSRLVMCEINSNHIEHARDLFVFACCTGMAYSDLLLFDKDKIRTLDGAYVYSNLRHKTKTEFTILLIPLALSILQKYNYKLPVISNQKYNQYLKLVAHYAEIDKQLTSHMARHTFATTVMLARAIPIYIVQKSLGHTKLSTTEKYAKVLDISVYNEMRKLL